MQQIWISRAGTPDVLELREAPDPEPGPGEVRVRVAASGINFADIMARMGLYPDSPPIPCVVGYEVAGVVDAVGEGVTSCSVGDRVVALTRFGGYASVLCAPENHVVALPDHISTSAGAAMPVNYLTAYLMLIELGNVQPFHTVLVHAAGGGVGQAAVQLCKWRGATVIGTASAPKHERLRESGVAHCIDYRSQDFEAEVMRITEGKGVDIVLDAVGGESFRKSYACLRHCGRLFMFGSSSMAPTTKRRLWPVVREFMKMPKFKPLELLDLNRGVFGVNLGHLWHESERLERMLAALMELMSEGVLVPVVDREFPFSQAAEAHAYIQARKNFGKVVLTTEP